MPYEELANICEFLWCPLCTHLRKPAGVVQCLCTAQQIVFVTSSVKPLDCPTLCAVIKCSGRYSCSLTRAGENFDGSENGI